MDAAALDHLDGDAAPGEDGGSTNDWLLRKIEALASVSQQGNGPDEMLGCDAVLLARLLLEEQMLDKGRSNGRGGKYGGRFHSSAAAPSWSMGTEREKEHTERGSAVGSRPLTVGELYANWPELRNVTRMGYPLIEADARSEPRNEDPMPKIRQCMKDLYAAAGRREKRSDDPSPSRQSSLARDILLDRRGYAAAGPRRAASLGAGTPPLLARSRPGRPIRRRRVRFQHEWVFGADRPTNESDRIEFRTGIRTTRASVQVE